MQKSVEMIPVLAEAVKNTKNAVFDYILIPISHHLLAIHCMKISEKKFKNKVFNTTLKTYKNK